MAINKSKMPPRKNVSTCHEVPNFCNTGSSLCTQMHFITHWRKPVGWDMIVCCCSLRGLTFFCFKLAPSAVLRFEWACLISLCKSLETKHSLHNCIDFSSKFEIFWHLYVFHWPYSRFGYGSIHQGAESSVQTFNTVTLHRLFHTVTWRKTHFYYYMSFSVMWTDGNKLHPDHQTGYTWKNTRPSLLSQHHLKREMWQIKAQGWLSPPKILLFCQMQHPSWESNSCLEHSLAEPPRLRAAASISTS